MNASPRVLSNYSATRTKSSEDAANLRQSFGLTLMVNHACNLRCTYCYTGAKFHSAMSLENGIAAIDRAFRSLGMGGNLNLGFFGGEPLLESPRILKWMDYARAVAVASGKHVGFDMTTNGTISTPEAWQVMMSEDLKVAVSFDGNPDIHDRHRQDVQGRGTSTRVTETMRELIQAGKTVCVVTVVRPDNLDELPDGLVFLHDLGIRQVELSLDLWTEWTAADGVRLQAFIERAASLWGKWIPEFHINWFEAKVADLAGLPTAEETTRCGFGAGEVAVAPSGRMYPCERLIGEDRADQPFQLPGCVSEGEDFANLGSPAFERYSTCSNCALLDACDTSCRCSNFVRTGDPNRPDGLLCLLNKATARAASAAMNAVSPPSHHFDSQNERKSNVE